jgi:putative ABC transport system permease protein
MPQQRSRFFQFPWRSRAQIARDVDTELAFHLEMRVGELVAQGLSVDDARARAREEFGDLEFTRNYCRNVDNDTDRSLRTADRLGELRQDAAYAFRTLRRSPGFAIVSIVTLALAIGANTAIFSVAQTVLLKPLPYAAPGSLVAFVETHPKNPTQRLGLSAPNLADYRAQQHTLTGIAALYTRIATWRSGNSDPQIATVTSVTSNMFEVLGVPAWRGRTFAADDGSDANNTKVVLSYQFWQTALGGDANIVGHTLTIYNRPYDVIGIMPRGFSMAYSEAFWVPFDLADDLSRAAVTRKQHVYNCFARLKPGVSLEAAQADLGAISARLDAAYPEINSDLRATLAPLRDALGRGVRDSVLLLLGAALLILLIACANLANMTLSRSMGRRTEMAVRAALGAGRGRLARQLLTESMMLSIVGGACGVLLAIVATRALLALNPHVLPAVFEIGIDGRILLFSVAVSVGTGILFGFAPAISAARADLQGALKDRGRGGTGSRASERLRHVLVVAQVSLAVMLLVGAGLLVRSFREVSTVHLGYDPSNVMTAQLRVDGARYDSSSNVNQFYDDVLGAIARTPGVVAVGASMAAPAQGIQFSTMFPEGAPPPVGTPPDIGYNMVRGDYFKVLKTPMIAGRTFNATDLPKGPKVAIINESAAHNYFPNGNAVGSRVRIGPNPVADWVTIVGVVGDMRDAANWAAPVPSIYDNASQETWWRSLSVVVRTSGDPMTVIPAIRAAVKSADPTLALRDVETLDEVIGVSLSARRFALGLAACFAVLALILAAVGIYGVLAYSVNARTREFGVRLALGATAGDVMMLVLRQGLRWSIAGLAIGIGGALAFGRLLASSLYGVSTTDSATFISVALGLLVVVLIACIVPAGRATRVDPINSLRAE